PRGPGSRPARGSPPSTTSTWHRPWRGSSASAWRASRVACSEKPSKTRTEGRYEEPAGARTPSSPKAAARRAGGDGPRLAHMVVFAPKDDSKESRDCFLASCEMYLSWQGGTVYFSVNTMDGVPSDSGSGRVPPASVLVAGGEEDVPAL